MMIKWREEHQTCENDEGVAIDRRIARPRQWVHAIVEPGKIFLAFEYLNMYENTKWIFMNIFSFMKTQHKKNMKALTKKSVCKMERKERKHDTYMYMIWRYFLFMEYIHPLKMCKKERQGNCSLSGACSVVQDRRRRREDRRRKTWKRRRR